jgi:hypothetical protein
MIYLSLSINDARLWTLWAKGRAVDNGFIVIHGKRPGSPLGELSYAREGVPFAG